MIHIEQGQIVPENEDLRVLAVSGDYDDNDVIECSTLSNPGFALYAFSSTFIKYGNIAYQFSDPLLLGEALLAIDPESTHDAVILYKEEEARKAKRNEGDFTPDNPVPVDETISPVAQEEAKVADANAVLEAQSNQVDNTLVTGDTAVPQEQSGSSSLVNDTAQTDSIVTSSDASSTPEILAPVEGPLEEGETSIMN